VRVKNFLMDILLMFNLINHIHHADQQKAVLHFIHRDKIDKFAPKFH